MISVIVLTRNSPTFTGVYLESLRACMPTLDAAGGAEFLLFDDCSDAGRETLPLLRAFADAVRPAPATVVRFRRQVHYAHGLAYALSMARGELVLFVSHDMIITPACIEEMLELAAGNSDIGIIRPVSEHMDWAAPFVVQPPHPIQTIEEAQRFSAEARSRSTGQLEEMSALIGDAMLIKRAVIDRIGVFDTSFYGYMADLDYGLRAIRAGFRQVIARGAWLHHEGNGAAKESAERGGPSVKEAERQGMPEFWKAFDHFRHKWSAALPPHTKQMRPEHFIHLLSLPPGPADAYQPPIALPPELVERFD
jgi:GT2 family glycosyltransferase